MARQTREGRRISDELLDELLAGDDPADRRSCTRPPLSSNTIAATRDASPQSVRSTLEDGSHAGVCFASSLSSGVASGGAGISAALAVKCSICHQK